jgi:hypothetical protein
LIKGVVNGRRADREQRPLRPGGTTILVDSLTTTWLMIRGSGSRVDIGVFGGHLRCAQAIAGLVSTSGWRRAGSGVGSLVARSMPTPDHATRALTSVFSVSPAVTSGSQAHGLVDAANRHW